MREIIEHETRKKFFMSKCQVSNTRERKASWSDFLSFKSKQARKLQATLEGCNLKLWLT